ncbi:unnamed protein product [Candidula unifasciata]|uniref:Uncharacterized protein n=1 Tax=Candidula unifasciata TaxID=100452 RepID=A0A8S3ZQH0_9EUPU|nr:unnamed protein product [Candidula unifasciata]
MSQILPKPQNQISDPSGFETKSQILLDTANPRLIRHLSTGSDLYITEGYDYVMKVILLGDQGVGKSSFLKALRVHPDVIKAKCSCRIASASDHLEVEVTTPSKKTAFVRLYDTGGQERYRSLTSSYYRGAHGVMLIFDVRNQNSLRNIESWLCDLDTFSSASSCVRVVIGSNCTATNREIPAQVARKYAESRGMPYMEMDTGHFYNVVESLHLVVAKIAMETSISTQHSTIIKPGDDWHQSDEMDRRKMFPCLC